MIRRFLADKMNLYVFSLMFMFVLLFVGCEANTPEAVTETLVATLPASTAAASDTPLPPAAATSLPTATDTPLPTSTRLPEPTEVTIASRPLAESGMIAFVSLRGPNDEEIIVMNADGSKQRNITNSPGFDLAPVWSPDGSKIAFMSNRTGDREIFIMNPDGSELTNFSNHPDNDLYPIWSPDGTAIAFESGQGEHRYILMDMNGTILDEWDIPPDWYRERQHLPDEQRPYLSYCKDENDEIKICGEEFYPTQLAGNEGFGPFPWSPDGTRLVFHSNANRTDDVNNIYVMSLDGSGVIQLTDSPYDDRDATWSPTWTTIPPTLADLCLQYEDLEAELPGFFIPEPSSVDRSLVDWTATGIYYTHYGASDIVFGSYSNAANPYIPTQRDSDLIITCSLKAYPDVSLAEHAIQLTTIADYYSIPSSEYCPDNTCYLHVLDMPIEYLPVPATQLPNPVVLIRYAKAQTGPNISLMTRYEGVVLRLNIDSWTNLLSTEETTDLLAHSAERIIERVTTHDSPFPPTIPQLGCLLMRGQSGCLLEILAVQLRLQQLGYAQMGGADGIFGPLTEQAVKDFQLSNELDVVGIISDDTWQKLFSPDAVPWP